MKFLKLVGVEQEPVIILAVDQFIIWAVVAVLALVALIYLLSPMSLLEDITTRGARIRTRLRELLPRHKYAGTTKNMVLAAYVDIALDHHKAIWHLHKSGLNGSALAMVRLVWDPYLRALWINKVGTEQQIEQASRDELRFPTMPKMREDIKHAYGDKSDPEQMEKLDEFFQRVKEAWEGMCSYTRSGGLQIGRRFTFDEVKPKYSEGVIAEALNAATLALLLLLQMFFVSMACYEEVKEVLTLVEQNMEFAKRLRTGQ
ncbi:MAG TPA: hypothetical protein VFH87_13670 [Candidatus Udaeobacter sp.]|nr:hypothetical protein [Candidatus Udaeobacter sp.]